MYIVLKRLKQHLIKTRRNDIYVFDSTSIMMNRQIVIDLIGSLIVHIAKNSRWIISNSGRGCVKSAWSIAAVPCRSQLPNGIASYLQGVGIAIQADLAARID